MPKTCNLCVCVCDEFIIFGKSEWESLNGMAQSNGIFEPDIFCKIVKMTDVRKTCYLIFVSPILFLWKSKIIRNSKSHKFETECWYDKIRK